MTYSLYYAEHSAAMGVRVLLEELGQPYELIETSIDMDTPRPAELLELNPNGWIPVNESSLSLTCRYSRRGMGHRLTSRMATTTEATLVSMVGNSPTVASESLATKMSRSSA